ncbi:hypothetical protein AB6A40_008452 [Gnathostoma spinigerum]|uniref:Uncharacterized protein n=1 Tax=Gnathostoma spinigerum TaxID=75299 RepID=A0ABD6EP54_9BILA
MPVRISMNPPSRRPFLIRSTTVPQHSVRTRNKAPHSSGTQRKQFVDGKNVRQNQVPVEHTEIDRSIMFKHAEADKTSATEYPSSTTTETIINDDQKQETEEVNESIRTTEAMPDLTDMPELTDMTDLAEIHELTDVPDLAESVDVTSPSANELSAEANSTPDITENEAESSAVTDILKEIEAQTSVETSKADDSSETPSTVARPAQSAQVVHKLERARKGKHPEEGAGESKDVTLNSVTSTQPTDGFEYEDDISTSPGLPNSDEAEGASVTKIPSTTKVLVKVNASSDKKQKDTRNYLEVTTRATNEMTEQSDANQDDYGEDYEEMNHSSTSKPRVPAKATRRHSTFSTPHPNFSKLL